MNDITVTKGSTEWDVEYTADQAATVTKTMETGGTVLDRDIHIEVTVPTGTEGTPVATKGTVSGNAVSVTPSVTNTGGFISGNTLTGTPVSVTASELVSGTKSITAAGTTDVTNYASASVSAGTAGTPTATKGTVSGNTVSVTPSVTNTAGFIAGGTLTGTPVSVSASELVSGTKSITASGTTDVTNYASASVAAGSAATPATSITANPTISVSSGGVITASVSKTQSVTPSVSAGFVSTGTAGTITVSGSATENLSTQAAQTITPTTSNIVIPSGKYLTGAQTILGDANLLAENIKDGVSIFNILGTFAGGGSGGWTRLWSKEYTAQVTGTSAVTLESGVRIDVGSDLWNADHLVLWVSIDKAGLRSGYCVGTTALIFPSSTAVMNAPMYSTNGTSVYFAAGNNYGVYPAGITRPSTQYSQLKVVARYSATYSKTIDGTFLCQMFSCEWPPNANPTDYSFT